MQKGRSIVVISDRSRETLEMAVVTSRVFGMSLQSKVGMVQPLFFHERVAAVAWYDDEVASGTTFVTNLFNTSALLSVE